ncbi:AcrR family transcriptional regulator [Tenggerimyces flavus]|nr:AcrR family transcriptional regulator [Tenggerimyces flavus]
MRQFGELGFDKATMRGIAEEARVSQGLVRHHFGSKEALRDACDAYLARAIERINEQVKADDSQGSINYVGIAGAAFGPFRQYVVRALVEGRATQFFDTLADLSAQWMDEGDRQREDEPDTSANERATVAAAMSLSIALLHPHIGRRLGVDPFSKEGEYLLARVLLDLYSHPYLTPDEAADFKARLPKPGHGK